MRRHDSAIREASPFIQHGYQHLDWSHICNPWSTAYPVESWHLESWSSWDVRSSHHVERFTFRQLFWMERRHPTANRTTRRESVGCVQWTQAVPCPKVPVRCFTKWFNWKHVRSSRWEVKPWAFFLTSIRNVTCLFLIPGEINLIPYVIFFFSSACFTRQKTWRINAYRFRTDARPAAARVYPWLSANVPLRRSRPSAKRAPSGPFQIWSFDWRNEGLQ